MKKKQRAFVVSTLSVILLLTTMASAAEPISVDADSVMGYARGGNPAILSNRYTLSMLSDGRKEANNAVNNLSELIDGLNAGAAALNSAAAGLVISQPAEGEEIPTALLETNRVMLQAVAQMNAVTAANVASLQTSVAQLKQSADKSSYEITRFSLQNANEQLAFGSLSMIMAYYDLNDKRIDLYQNYLMLERKAETVKKMAELGMVSPYDNDAMVQGVKDMKLGIEALDNALSALKGQIAAYIGKDPDAVNINDFTGIDRAYISSEYKRIEENSDYGEALKNSLDIAIADLNPGFDSDIDANSDAERKLEYVSRRHKAAFDAMKADTNQKLAALDSAFGAMELKTKEFSLSELKYNLGMISKNDYEDASATLIISGLTLKKAQRDYKLSFEKLAALRGGIWIQS